VEPRRETALTPRAPPAAGHIEQTPPPPAMPLATATAAAEAAPQSVGIWGPRIDARSAKVAAMTAEPLPFAGLLRLAAGLQPPAKQQRV
jgi:hypothetical protein